MRELIAVQAVLTSVADEVSLLVDEGADRCAG